MNTKLWVALTALSLSAAGMAADARSAARANNEFGVRLFQNVSKQTAKGNKFLSPTSAYLALSMAYNGSDSYTRSEMEETLSLTGLTRDDVNAGNLALATELTTGRDVELRLANALWANQGFNLKPTFVNAVRANYGGTLEVLDFALPSAPTTINDWVKAQTKNKITSIVSGQLPPDMRLLLVNATYFEGEWQTPFAASSTRNDAFTKADGTVVQVPVMHGQGRWKHVANADYEAIELPYGKSGETSMVVVVPKNDLTTFEAELTGSTWNDLVTGLDGAQAKLGTLALPNIEINYDSSLVDALTKMGMRQAFTDQAQFGSLSDEAVKISDVLQKTYVKVFEKGTIAAAVTSIGFTTTSIPQYDYHMNVNRPYAFGLRDKRTGALLFLGTVQEPEGGKIPARPARP